MRNYDNICYLCSAVQKAALHIVDESVWLHPLSEIWRIPNVHGQSNGTRHLVSSIYHLIISIRVWSIKLSYPYIGLPEPPAEYDN